MGNLHPITVVIPTYNGSKYVAECLSSAFAQTLAPREIIVVDDCSTDDTPEVVKRIAYGSSIPVRLVQLGHNSGTPTVPMNVGVAASSTPFVCLCDQDDIMAPNRLERQVAALLAHPNVGLSCGRILSVDRHGTPLTTPGARSPGPDHELQKTQVGPSLFYVSGDVAHLSLLHGKWMAGGASGLCFSKQIWESVGGFNERFRIAWDYDFALKITTRHDIVYDDAPVSFQRMHDENLSRLHTLCALEMAESQWNHYRNMDRPLSLEQRRLKLSELSLVLGWEHREQGNYLRSARFYLAHCWYGNPFRSAVGLAKVAAVCGLRLFNPRSAA